MPPWQQPRPSQQPVPPSAPETPPAELAEAPWPEHPTLVGLRERLQLVLDCWSLLELADGTSRRTVYLPQGTEEPTAAYERRLAAARPTGFFRDALRTYAGMLSRLSWSDLPDSLGRIRTDADGNGTDLEVLLFLADLLVLRDGGCLVLILPPAHAWPSEGDRLAALAAGDRHSLPRLQLIPRGDLLNWQLATETRGEERIGSGPLQIQWRQPLRGSEEEPFCWSYHRLRLIAAGVEQQSWQVVADPTAASGQRLAPLTGAERISERQELPAIWYSVDGSGFGEGELPYLGLAHQYLNHYRCRSDYEDLLSRTALPVGVRTGLVDRYGFRKHDGPGNNELPQQRPQRLVLSSSSFMDLPEGASFQWVEIEGIALPEHRAYLQQLEETMRRDALIPAATGGPARTELEVSLSAGQSYAVLQSLAGQKTSMVHSLLQQWTRLSGEPLAATAGVELRLTPLVPPPPPSPPAPTAADLLVLHERGVLSDGELRQQLGLAAGNG